MGATWSFTTTFVAGNVLTAAQLNTLQSDVTTNFTPTGMDDASANTTAWESTSQPSAAPIDLNGELKQLRYQVEALQSVFDTSKTKWTDAVPTTLANDIFRISPRDQSRDLVIGAVTDTTVDIDASEVILQDANGTALRVTSVNLTIDVTNQWNTDGSTKDGLGRDDGNGTMDSSTWYNIWLVYGSSDTVSGVITTQATLANVLANAVSTGGEYDTYASYVGSIYSDSSGDLIPFTQLGNKVYLETTQQIVSNGAATSYTDVGALLDVAVPSTAKGCSGNFRVDSSGGATVTNAKAWLAMDSSGTGEKTVEIAVGGASDVFNQSPYEVGLTSQILYYKVSEANDRFNMWVSGWEY